MEKYEISGGISPFSCVLFLTCYLFLSMMVLLVYKKRKTTGPDHDPDQDNERNDQEKDANKSIEKY